MRKIIVLVSFLIVSVWLLNKINNHGSCNDAEEMEQKNYYNGVVIKKYIDKNNHNYKIVEIKGLDRQVHKELMDWDKSGLFEYIEKGDSIVKELNTLKVSVFRDKVEFFFLIDYKCRD